MRRAKDAGYEVGLVVALRDAELNVQRVAMRVASGGHNIPEAIIRRRYDVSFERLSEAVRIADSVLVFDNTEEAGPSLLVRLNVREIETNNLLAGRLLHSRVATSIAKGLDLPPDRLLGR